MREKSAAPARNPPPSPLPPSTEDNPTDLEPLPLPPVPPPRPLAVLLVRLRPAIEPATEPGARLPAMDPATDAPPERPGNCPPGRALLWVEDATDPDSLPAAPPARCRLEATAPVRGDACEPRKTEGGGARAEAYPEMLLGASPCGPGSPVGSGSIETSYGLITSSSIIVGRAKGSVLPGMTPRHSPAPQTHSLPMSSTQQECRPPAEILLAFTPASGQPGCFEAHTGQRTSSEAS